MEVGTYRYELTIWDLDNHSNSDIVSVIVMCVHIDPVVSESKADGEPSSTVVTSDSITQPNQMQIVEISTETTNSDLPAPGMIFMIEHYGFAIIVLAGYKKINSQLNTKLI